MRVPGLLLAIALAGCTGKGATITATPVPRALADLSAALASASAGTPLPVGTLLGRVERFDGQGFAPAAGATVTVSAGGLTATTDADGRYGFSGLPPGNVELKTAPVDALPFTLVCQLSGVMGLAGANLLLVPSARPDKLPAGAVAIAGVLADPRGAALPNGTVHAVDAVSNGGKGSGGEVKADADGYFVDTLKDVGALALNNGQAELTGYGTTPGGVNVETTDIQTLTIDSRPAQAVVVGTTAYLNASNLAWAGGDGRSRSLTADHLPTRRDELVLHLEQDGRGADVLADSLAGGRATFSLPDGFVAGHGTVEPRVLGLAPAPSVAIGS